MKSEFGMYRVLKYKKDHLIVIFFCWSIRNNLNQTTAFLGDFLSQNFSWKKKAKA